MEEASTSRQPLLDNWVLCKVYKKKQGKKQDGETSGKGTTADEDEGEGRSIGQLLLLIYKNVGCC
ncbi:hypothetical protein CCACVL1_16178 [Corchorus capsularis]|uniref:No apical meristem (NAM) protein n=1 Tax=Corchorus capsularis TaxID=210143 RepID=A0A1R3HYP1_COCAP|nr:hypothetical protein CCACVL1_16178 [Corchorus capsularis]